MKKYLATLSLSLCLPLFLIAGCESEQASQPQNTASTSTAAQSTQAAEDDSASTETTSDTTDTSAVSTAMAQADTASAAKQDPRSGEQVYQQYCGTCHKTGVANAPKFADKAAWEPRIAKGKDALYQSAMKGVAGTAMTPKGSCMNCSEDELKAAVDYMVENAQ
ncbi:MAG TPA: c-type cytochrome [Gammaproteobacteria bacterium]